MIDPAILLLIAVASLAIFPVLWLTRDQLSLRVSACLGVAVVLCASLLYFSFGSYPRYLEWKQAWTEHLEREALIQSFWDHPEELVWRLEARVLAHPEDEVAQELLFKLKKHLRQDTV